jgi:selenium-binding protein 1
VVDTHPDPRNLRRARVIEPEAVSSRTGYARPHTVRCRPDRIYISDLGNPEGGGPGGIFVIDHYTFEVLGRWDVDRGPQFLAYDFWWHLGYNVMVTSEWGMPRMVEQGVDVEALLNGRYGHRLRLWDLRRRRHAQSLDLSSEHQMVLELRPAHDPTRACGFARVILSLKDLSASAWLWYRENGAWSVRKVIEIPAEPADPDQLPPILKDFRAVPPLVTDINLSLDDRFLYVSCWGTGELRQYDACDPFHPQLRGAVRFGGIASRAPHPKDPARPLNGGPQMVGIRWDGRRVYVTNPSYIPWDPVFYPEGIRRWLAKLDAGPDGRLAVDPACFVEFGDDRPHPVRLEGGDASSVPSLRGRDGGLDPVGQDVPAGAYHGLDPAMGWLFALALRSTALGRLLAVGLAARLLLALQAVLPLSLLRGLTAAVLAAFGVYRLARAGHPHRVGMRVGFRDRIAWSMRMASSHGVGLMPSPFLLGPLRVVPGSHGSQGLHSAWIQGLPNGLGEVGAHPIGYLLTAGPIA